MEKVTPVAQPNPAQLAVEGEKLARDWSRLEFLVVKVTQRCNLSCSYCYEDIGPGSDMSLATFTRLADVALESTASPTMGFLFHGGEPTLLDVDWYRQAMDYADVKAKELGKSCSYTMQSNLVKVAPEFMDFMLERNVSVGVSMDGPPEMNDSSRGGGDKVVENFKKAKSAGLRVSVLTTINGSNWNRMPEIIDYLENELGERRFKANVAYAVGAGQGLQPLTGEQIFAARKDILDHMLKTGGNGLVEANLEKEVLKFVAKSGCDTSLCDGQLCGAGSRVLGVSPEGGLLPCGRFEWNDSSWSLGNIFESDGAASEFRGSQMRRFWGVSDYNWANCSTCRAKRMCSYSCQAFILRSNQQLNIECLPTLSLYDYLAGQPRGRAEALAATLRFHQMMGKPDVRDSTARSTCGTVGYSDYTDGTAYNDYPTYPKSTGYSDYTDGTAYNDYPTYPKSAGYSDYTDGTAYNDYPTYPRSAGYSDYTDGTAYNDYPTYPKSAGYSDYTDGTAYNDYPTYPKSMGYSDYSDGTAYNDYPTYPRSAGYSDYTDGTAYNDYPTYPRMAGHSDNTDVGTPCDGPGTDGHEDPTAT